MFKGTALSILPVASALALLALVIVPAIERLVVTL